MRKIWTLGAMGASLAALLAAGGCYDFDQARKDCVEQGRCEPEGVGPDTDAGTDGGTDAGTDAGLCQPRPGVDLPDDGFDDSNCDGVDGEASEGFFVNPNGGNDSNAGTRQAPLSTLREALARLQMMRDADGGGPVRVYLAGGAYNETGLELKVAASLHGGYVPGAERWNRDAGSPALLNGGTVGFTVQGVPDAGIVMEYMHVRSADAGQSGEPSIAMRVLGSSDVRLRYVTLEAGLGAPGLDGAQGETGAIGRDGGSGTNASGSTAGNSGSGSSGTCAGAGGNGGGGVYRGDGENGGTGASDTPGGQGGSSGTVDCSAGTACTCVSGTGDAGAPGNDGGTGTQGAAGGGQGELRDGGWFATQQGGDGGTGRPGASGGGGGGGGSCRVSIVDVAASGGGGGGGAGGCGGTGGTGGGGGGASIALLLFSSQVSVEDGSRLVTSGGGTGGRGGNGGPGGSGGVGGGGGGNDTVVRTAGDGTQYVTTSGRGGRGGNGGNGGNGGAGGGGGGGPSVGIWCAPGAGVTLADGVTITPGGGGAGGASTGLPGDTGVSQPIIGCPTNP